MMNTRVIKDDATTTVPIEKALEDGKLDVADIMGNGERWQCVPNQFDAAEFGVEGVERVPLGISRMTVEDDECVWTLKASNVDGATPDCEDNGDCELPRYFDSGLRAIKESAAPPELRQRQFPARDRDAWQTYSQLWEHGRR